MFADETETTISMLKPKSRIVRSPTEQPSFTCIASAPNITWTYANSRGEEMKLTTDGGERTGGYRIESTVSQTKDRKFTTRSTITFLELSLAKDEGAIVRCRVSNSIGITTAKPDGFFVICKSSAINFGYSYINSSHV